MTLSLLINVQSSTHLLCWPPLFPPTASTKQLHCAMFILITFKNQNNGVIGKAMGYGHSAPPSPTWYVQLTHSLSPSVTPSQPNPFHMSRCIRSTDITNSLCLSILNVAPNLVLCPKYISNHDMHDGGFITLFLGWIDDDKIKLFRWWFSDMRWWYISTPMPICYYNTLPPSW